MNRRAAITLAAGVALLGAAGAASAHDSGRQRTERVAVVLAGPAATDPALRAVAARAGAEVRVPATPTEQLGVAHLLAAEGYARVITVDADAPIAVDPVAARYPGTRFVASADNAAALVRTLAVPAAK
jgi:hypothetical protein